MLKKKLIISIAITIIVIVTLIITVPYIGVAILFRMGDANYKRNVKYYAISEEDVLKYIRPTSHFNREEISREQIDFEIYDESYNGRHRYSVWLKNMDRGAVYLQIFYLKNNKPAEDLGYFANTTRIRIPAINDEIKEFGPERFLIHGGIIGYTYPFVAKFELWYEDSNGENKEKLLTKIYRINE